MADQKISGQKCIAAFLGIVVSHPEKPPRTKRAERDNKMMILGFNQAQEALRTILREYGRTESVAALADTRAKGQIKPTQMGDTNIWIA